MDHILAGEEHPDQRIAERRHYEPEISEKALAEVGAGIANEKTPRKSESLCAFQDERSRCVTSRSESSFRLDDSFGKRQLSGRVRGDIAVKTAGKRKLSATDVVTPSHRC